jgi:hypothetical protein
MPRRQWSAQEIRLLADKYPEKGLACLAKSLDRSEDSITSMATRLGLRSENRHRHQAQARVKKAAIRRQEIQSH